MELNEKQKKAITLAHDWFYSDSKQQFVIAGYAGTGKTTVVRAIIDDLGLSNQEVCFATYTGKAALVLTKMGCEAITLHKLIYMTQKIWDEKENCFKYIFTKYANLSMFLRLIVVDESSMVPPDIYKDLMSFGIKVIFLGDPGQLPPVTKDKTNNIMDNPDIFLTEIHRQAEGNPIIYLATCAREGKWIEKNVNYNNKVFVIEKGSKLFKDKYLLNADQVLVGKNKTRDTYNDYIRQLLGKNPEHPEKGDKIIFTRNNWGEILKTDNPKLDIPIVNGLVGTIEDIEMNTAFYNSNIQAARVLFSIQDDSVMTPLLVSCNTLSKEFKDTKPNFGRIAEYENKNECTINYADYGYAITVHKSQGSQWNKVLVINEYLGEHDKWLYTAITRAIDKLILIM